MTPWGRSAGTARIRIDPVTVEMISPVVDSFSSRLRQYVPVPADVTTAAASSLAVDIRTFPWIRRLASDYAFAFANVAPFFAGDPATPAAWADTITRSQSFTRQPAEIATVIAAQQAQRNAPAASRDAGARLADPATRVIITGQQAGLFGGPLFTLLKAITTMKLAAEVSKEHRVPVRGADDAGQEAGPWLLSGFLDLVEADQ